MRTVKIVSGGALRRSGPALRVNRDRPGSVRRRSGRRPAELFPQWGDDPRPVWRRIDWRMWAFIVGWAVVFGVFVYIGLERAGW